MTTNNITPNLPEDTSEKLWRAVEGYTTMGLSVMWGYAEDTIIKGRVKKAKSPVSSTWSSEPEFTLSLDTLSKTMVTNATTRLAPIIICGAGSGNLEAIDIDTKFWPDIATKYFNAIAETYPSVWVRLRIHQTPSKGFHILYRLLELIKEGNQKLAYPADGKEAGIETRCHGGYIMAPPGMGYTVYRDVPIPTITREERDALYALARLYNQKKKPVAVPSQKKYESTYDQNPFQHFNSSPEAEQVLTNNGWVIDSENTQWVHYTRPGKDHGVSASFHKESRFYHIFTTSTEFDGDKTYDPAAVLSILQFNNDNKKLFAYLTGKGFGKHNPAYEAKFIKKIVQTGRPLPKNFSEEAQEQLKIATEDRNERYPHGIFWEYSITNDSYGIQRQLLAQFMVTIGMRVHKGEACIIEGQFIRKLKEDKKENGAREAYNLLHSWIREEEQETYLRITHTFSQFWQSSGEFMVSLLPEIDKRLILKSNSKVSYKFFKNGILEITADRKEIYPFVDRTGSLIWKDQVIDREFKYVGAEEQRKSMYGDFIRKALEGDPMYVRLCIGWLCCGYKVDGEDYLLSLEEPMDTSKGGGTGKGLFMKILRQWMSVLITNGESVSRDVDQLIQNWNDEEIDFLDEVPKGFDLGKLKHIITEDSQKKVLYKNIYNIAAADMPKFVISGQWVIITKEDGAIARRVRKLAFSGYFNGRHGVRDEYGGIWPGIWKESDWDGYYSMLADCVKEYKQVNALPMVENKGLWLKEWDARFSSGDSWFREAIEENWESWIGKDVAAEYIRKWYDELCELKGIPNQWRMKTLKRIHGAIKEYGEKMSMYEYEYGINRKTVGNREMLVRVTRMDVDE
ncbi:MAG: bifunctional DNA primase/polymerase [Saprospiraceae bacterium]